MSTNSVHKLTIPLHADRLVGTLEQPSAARTAVLYVHGFGSDRSGNKAVALRRTCQRRGWNYAAFDFRCHGESTGRRMLDLRASRLQEDLQAIAAELQLFGIDRLYLFGSSMGGFASAWFALRGRQQVPALALVAPAFHFLDNRVLALTEQQREAWRQSRTFRFVGPYFEADLDYGLLEERGDFSVEHLIARWQTPALLFQGMRDDTVLWQDTVAVVEKIAVPGVEVRLYNHGDHRLLDHAEEMAEEACRFFARHGCGE